MNLQIMTQLWNCLLYTSMSWLDGSNTKTRRYLWAPLKYGKYADNPVSVSAVSYTHLDSPFCRWPVLQWLWQPLSVRIWVQNSMTGRQREQDLEFSARLLLQSLSVLSYMWQHRYWSQRLTEILMLYIMESVSYTHLDVYKRQILIIKNEVPAFISKIIV